MPEDVIAGEMATVTGERVTRRVERADVGMQDITAGLGQASYCQPGLFAESFGAS